MSRRWFAALVVVLMLCLMAYVLVRGFLSEGWQKLIYAENGPIELGTAVMFALAGGVAFVLARGTRGKVSNGYRVMFFLFAAISIRAGMKSANSSGAWRRWRMFRSFRSG